MTKRAGADADTDADALYQQETYEAFFRLDDPHDDAEERLPAGITDHAESLMRQRVDETATVEGKWFLEGECITIENGIEHVSYWIRIPFNWDA